MKPTTKQAKLLKELKKASVAQRPAGQDLAAQWARVMRLNLLYELSGRSSGIFTGLESEAEALGL